MPDIDDFSGEFEFLSNFYPSPITVDGVTYPTVEHGYQAAKAIDPQQRNVIAQALTPWEAKRLGREAELRPDWNDVKLAVMRRLLVEKFQHPTLAKLLQETAPGRLVEGNTWHDTFWGVCDGVGENHLGRLLTEIRDDLSGRAASAGA